MKYYKKIPKKLRKEYKSRIKSRFWRILRAKRRFGKMYKARKELFAMGEIKDNLHLDKDHLYWDFNTTERNYEECVYGDQSFQRKKKFNYKTATPKQKKRQARKWFRRNPVWNWTQRVGVELGGGFDTSKTVIIHNEPKTLKPTLFRNKKHLGIQSVILTSKSGIRTFRYSHTLPLKKLSLWRLLGFKYKNVMRGADKDQYTYKNRLIRKLDK